MAERKRRLSLAKIPEAQRPPDGGEPDRSEGGFASSEVSPAPASRPLGLKDALFALGLLTTLLLIYQPAWHGGFIWDDDRVNRPRQRQQRRTHLGRFYSWSCSCP